jgi:hypothetical protein
MVSPIAQAPQDVDEVRRRDHPDHCACVLVPERRTSNDLNTRVKCEAT